MGTQVTLACDIIDRGFPPATFGWIRDGHDLRNDHSVIANGSVISLTMCNVKIASAGKYTCTASNAGLSYRTDTVELNVLESKEVIAVCVNVTGFVKRGLHTHPIYEFGYS